MIAIIKNAQVLGPDFTFKKGDIYMRDGQFFDTFDDNPECYKHATKIDAEGLYAIPGLVDMHFHGAVGHDFSDGTAEAILNIARYEASRGVLAISPATMTLSEEILSDVMTHAKEVSNNIAHSAYDGEALAHLVGINMEGPFISPNKIGAQNPKYIKAPDVDMFHRLQEKSGNLIKLVDIAPEVPGALDMISRCKDEVRFSIAHTCATYEEAIAAFDAGATHMTHLYNAMPGITHRAPGPIIAALERGAEVELIADGVHSHPATIAFTFNVFGKDRVILISDSMMACGLDDGEYELGGQKVTVKGPRAVLSDDPDTIAGSATDLLGCVKYAVTKAQIPLEDAVRAASLNPAISLGIDKEYGSIEAGKYANLVLIDKDFNIKGAYSHSDDVLSPSKSNA